MNNNNFQEAIDMFNRSLEYPINKDYVIYANYWKGEALSYLKDYNAAINAYAAVFTNTREDNEYYLKTRYGIGYAYYNTKQFDKALPHFRAYVDKVKADKNKQNYNDALLRLADLYYVTKQYEQAIKYYDEAVADKSSDIDYAYYQRGLVKMNLGEVLEAKTNFEAVIKRYPNSLYYDDALFQEGQLELQTGENSDAVKAYSALIGIKPGSPYAPYAYSRRAIAYFNLKDYEKAIKDYQYILDNLPTHEESQNALKGIQEALAAAGREEEFPTILAKFKEYNPDNKESASLTVLEFENAKALYNNQKYPQAIQSFLTFISGNPGNPNVKEAQYYMAESYYRQNELTSAIEYYKKVIEDRTSSYYNKAIQRLADLSLLNKDYQSAKNYYQILLAQARGKKDRSIANVGLVEAYYNTQKYDSATYYTSEILKQGNSTLDAESKAMLYQGKIAMAKGENDKAVDHFIQTINAAKDINAAEAQYLMAKIQYNDKKYKQSLETLYDLNNNYSIYDDWLGRSFLLIAENFVALNELFQAKATLKSIIEKSPHKETVEKAKVRLSELESKEKDKDKDKDKAKDKGKESEIEENGQEGNSNE
ncbi:MAG: tetratricopeptide repeat protein [Sporocytophaga sp.]|nr:tetratricopeptide repeat protein [Sporocytophaga sp.]